MKRTIVAALAALAALAGVSASTAARPDDRPGQGVTGNGAAAAPAAAPSFTALQPGGLSSFGETVPVNVVFVGFTEQQVPWSQVLAELPASYEPVVRSRLWYGNLEPLGLEHRFAYHGVYTDATWNDAFFAFLAGKAEAKPRTLFQDDYNAQGGALDVGQNHWIPAADVERYLIANAPAGVNPKQPTVFYVNWHSDQSGANAFRFHVYTKIGEPDPDTGYDFGLQRSSRKLVAWGGTAWNDEETGYDLLPAAESDPWPGKSARVWFYDLSAGPESWGGSYDVDNADIDGDGVADYRLPAVWDYSPGAGGALQYAHPGYGTATLAKDLGLVTRYAAINLLFTTSPLYPPYYKANRIPETVNLDVNTVEGWNQVNASEDLIDRPLFLAEERELPTGRQTTLTADYQVVEFNGDFARCYQQFVSDKSCYNNLHPYYTLYGGFPNFFLVTGINLGLLLDGNADYEAALVNWSVGMKPKAPGLLGFADDNWLDGTQSGVFSAVYPDVAPFYGLTTTMIHEYGHHSSMSHPHDGFDSEDAAATSGEPWLADYGPSGPTFFAWLADESNSMMSYIDLNWDFSQFDRDNSARHHAAGYAMVANRIAAVVLAENDPAANAALALADADLGQAQAELHHHDYAGFLAEAKSAYHHTLHAAELAGVDVDVLEPSHFTIVGPVKPGNAKPSRERANYAKDLDDRANLRRMAP